LCAVSSNTIYLLDEFTQCSIISNGVCIHNMDPDSRFANLVTELEIRSSKDTPPSILDGTLC
jgi:hypothetical protein